MFSECEGLDAVGKAVLARCQQLQKLLLFYQFTSGLQQKPPNYDSVVADDSNNDVQVLYNSKNICMLFFVIFRQFRFFFKSVFIDCIYQLKSINYVSFIYFIHLNFK